MTATLQRIGEKWLLALIARRGRRQGLAGADLDDAVQEVAPAVLDFEYDPERWQGASLRTVLTAVIDRRLRALRRREARYRRHIEMVLDAARARYETAHGAQEPYYEEPTEVAVDVRAVVAALSDEDRAICVALSEGCSLAEVALRLACDWHTVNRRVAKIREEFERLGLDGWLHE